MNDFGTILDKWEKAKGSRKADGASEEYRYEPKIDDHQSDISRRDRVHPRKWRINDTLDIHGLTAAEAKQAVAEFMRSAKKKEYRKVLIIHGRGIHSNGEPVLRSVVHSFLDTYPHAGMRMKARKKDGGSGALWVVIK